MPISLLLRFFFISLISTIISITKLSHAYNQCLDDQKTLLLELKSSLTFDSSVSRKLTQWDEIEDCCNWEGVECDAAGHVINLQLDYEAISGTIENLSSLSGLTYLEKLNLAYNSISGSIPQSLFILPSLQQLKLSNNNFTGLVHEFPSLNLSNLEELDLSSNHLEGPIPDSFFKLESLQLLSLSNNFFNGTFQLQKIRGLRNLTTLNLSYNNLSVVNASTMNSYPSSTFPNLYQLSLVSCNLSSFPDLRNQSNLRFLDLSNNRIAGEIPNWIWEIGSGEFWQLNLSYNHLVDLQKPYEIPSSLQVLDLHSNQLGGELPLPQERALYVDYSNNKFDKPIPVNIGNYLSNLVFFSVSNNSLSGTIPTTLCDATYLQVLDLSFNYLSGNIPSCLFKSLPNLGVFNLRRNNITGRGGFEGVRVFNVGINHIDDSFPCMLPSSIRVLVLRSNRFHGEIRCNKDWPDLQIIDISSNGFSGSLYPLGFSSLRRMMLESDGQSRHEQLYFNFLNLQNLYYQDEVTLTIKGLQLKLVKIWSEFTSLDFSCNNFNGEIPEAIGDLSSLYLLNLSHNALTGSIPKSFGNMASIEALDLSVNQLTEAIPVELGRLGFLQVLNLSYNKLVGMIPNSPQFVTFTVDSFEGNTGLCGFPLGKSCSSHGGDDSSSPKLEKGKSEMEWCYISAEIGYTVGLGSTVWLLLFCRSLRESYFQKVDDVLGKIYEWDQIEDCCKWEGVECDAAGHVASLQLDYEAISGRIENSSNLASLKYLKKLNLAHNSLSGSMPWSLFNLPSLELLILSNNKFSGRVHEFPSLNLSNLVELDLSDNHLNGTIPDSFFNLESLEILSLSNNLFSDTFQLEKIQNLTNLTSLNLSYNNLSVDASSINTTLSGISQLKKLSLASCNLHNFPDVLKQSNLIFLDLSDNQITGEIPSWIWGIGNGALYHLNLSHNLLVDLQKPYHIPSFLAELDLHSNQLRGELPLLPRGASYVDFSDNQFDKPIPLNFVSSNLFLIFLSIANNTISGSIPTSICGAVTIQLLDFSLNNLSGSIPPCLVASMSNLQAFYLRRNNISGDIPDKFSTDCGLRILDFSYNNLGGNFPKSLGNCKPLEMVNVGNNKIEGSLPCMLPSRLRVLVLRYNRFHGEVKCGESWRNLQIIDISSNNFSGELHHISFSRWTKMVQDNDAASWRHSRSLDINVVRPDFYYSTLTTLTVKGRDWQYSRILGLIRLVDFSANNFQGELPDEIGSLKSLDSLNLSHNALTGIIPKSLGNMAFLDGLDLSANQLTGVIPEELERLVFLSFFNVSYNKLVGKIPSRLQFSTFANDSYLGNSGLCGMPLSKRCSDDNDSSQGKRETHDSHVSLYIVGLGSIIWLLS
ncbi:hypothetical protein C2S52_006573 [Perilla frutescens var. hirtella]|nr:hypothetical protein C2S52_006573 [Perilla frutescens var. hirtella]